MNPSEERMEDDAARLALINALIELRARAGLGQRTVATRMGTVQSAVSELERGYTEARLSTLQRFARACNGRITIRLEVDGDHIETPEERLISAMERLTVVVATLNNTMQDSNEDPAPAPQPEEPVSTPPV